MTLGLRVNPCNLESRVSRPKWALSWHKMSGQPGKPAGQAEPDTTRDAVSLMSGPTYSWPLCFQYPEEPVNSDLSPPPAMGAWTLESGGQKPTALGQGVRERDGDTGCIPLPNPEPSGRNGPLPVAKTILHSPLKFEFADQKSGRLASRGSAGVRMLCLETKVIKK